MKLSFYIYCFLTLVLNWINVIAIKKGIPEYIHICKRNDPEIRKCLLDNVEIIRPYLKTGIPEMRIPGVDPLFLPKVSMELSGFQASFINSTITGCTNFVLKDIDIDFENIMLGLQMFFDQIYLLGSYEFKGKLLMLELNGKGFSSTNVSNLNAHAVIKGVKEIRNNKTYINFNDNKLKLEVESAKMRFDGLFGDNEELTDATNKIVNENAQDFIKELIPIIEETVGAFVFSVTTNVFKTFPLETLFPEE